MFTKHKRFDVTSFKPSRENNQQLNNKTPVVALCTETVCRYAERFGFSYHASPASTWSARCFCKQEGGAVSRVNIGSLITVAEATVSTQLLCSTDSELLVSATPFLWLWKSRIFHA